GEGTVKNFDGDMDDYRRLVLDRTGSGTPQRKERVEAAEPRRDAKRRDGPPLRRKVEQLEDQMSKFQTLLTRVDAALGAPDAFKREPAKAQQLAQQRRELEKALMATEEEWLKLTEAAEREQVG